MSVCRPPLLMPTPGDLKPSGADGCGTGALRRAPPHRAHRHRPFSARLLNESQANGARTAAGRPCAVRTDLVSTFAPSHREQKSFFSAHLHPTMQPMRTHSFFPSSFHNGSYFFPCSPFRGPIWGTEAIKPAENEKITL